MAIGVVLVTTVEVLSRCHGLGNRTGRCLLAAVTRSGVVMGRGLVSMVCSATAMLTANFSVFQGSTMAARPMKVALRMSGEFPWVWDT